MCLKSLSRALGSGRWCSKGGLRSCTRSWVDILRGRLWRHLYDPRFVNDASRAVSFLYNPDDPRLVALAVFWGFDLGTEAGGLLPGQTDKQASCKEEGIWSVSDDVFSVAGECSALLLLTSTDLSVCSDSDADHSIVVLRARVALDGAACIGSHPVFLTG